PHSNTPPILTASCADVPLKREWLCIACPFLLRRKYILNRCYDYDLIKVNQKFLRYSYFSFSAASSTACAWPATLTLFQTCATWPSLSMRKVVRSTPIYLRPYMLFSTQTP